MFNFSQRYGHGVVISSYCVVWLLTFFCILQVGALSQRRIIAFFNEFVGQTVGFLNKFSSECEEKLFIVDTRLEKLETMLSILEAKVGKSKSAGLQRIII